MNILDKNNIVYQTLNEDRLDETIGFVTKHFVDYEYLTRESRLTFEEFNIFSRLYCEASLKHNLSLIALDKTTNELVGFAINEDPNSEIAVDPTQFYAVSEHYTPFLKMLENLSNKYLKIAREPRNSFHLYLLGVKPSYQGRKIGKTLVEASELVAKQSEFNYIVIEATSPLTKPICENLGYTNLGSNVYKDFTIDENRPFAHVVDYDGPHLFMKELC